MGNGIECINDEKCREKSNVFIGSDVVEEHQDGEKDDGHRYINNHCNRFDLNPFSGGR
jgi:hypothetical protein